jgi:hypothetical protein
MKTRMHWTLSVAVVGGFVALTNSALAGGPSSGFTTTANYVEIASSPFNSPKLVWDDFEFGLNPVGLSIVGVVSLEGGNSVDGDDGFVDGVVGSGKTTTNSLRLGNWNFPLTPANATVIFDSIALGGFPVKAGFVVTDASGLDDINGNPIPLSVNVQAILADGTPVSTTIPVRSEFAVVPDDLFIGFQSAAGISSLTVSCELPIAIDHFQYELAPAFVPPVLRDDFDGDGRSDVAWFNNVSAGAAIWNVNGSVVSGGYTNITPSSNDLKLVATGDINGGGRADMLWYNQATSRYTVWLTETTPFTSIVIDRPVPADWVPAGLVDVNNDRQADIVFRKTGGGKTYVAVWMMDGGLIRDALLNTLDGEFSELHVGQFDTAVGADALLRKSDGADRGAVFVANFNGMALSAPTRIVGTSGGTEPAVGAGWEISGVADVDGDGIDDVIWRGDGGSVVRWSLANLGIASKGVIWASTGAYWKIVGFPDFDGDGTRGIMFRGGGGETWHWRLVNGVIQTGDSGPLNTVSNAWRTPLNPK